MTCFWSLSDSSLDHTQSSTSGSAQKQQANVVGASRNRKLKPKKHQKALPKPTWTSPNSQQGSPRNTPDLKIQIFPKTSGPRWGAILSDPQNPPNPMKIKTQEKPSKKKIWTSNTKKKRTQNPEKTIQNPTNKSRTNPKTHQKTIRKPIQKHEKTIQTSPKGPPSMAFVPCCPRPDLHRSAARRRYTGGSPGMELKGGRLEFWSTLGDFCS